MRRERREKVPLLWRGREGERGERYSLFGLAAKRFREGEAEPVVKIE